MRNGTYTGPRLNFFTLRDTDNGAAQRFLGEVYESGFIDELNPGTALQYEPGRGDWCSRVVKAGGGGFESVGARASRLEAVSARVPGRPEDPGVFHGPHRGYFRLRDGSGKFRRFSRKAFFGGPVSELKRGDRLLFEWGRGGWCACVIRRS